MPSRPLRNAWLLALVKWTIAAVVAWGIWRTVADARAALDTQSLRLDQLKPAWLAFAAACYVFGLLPMAWFWHRVLHAFGQHPTPGATLHAYFVGHLGKYVPGKAMVVVLRTAWIHGPQVDARTAAVSVFVETITMLAAGAFSAALMLAAQSQGHGHLLLMAIALMIAAGLPTCPPVFRAGVRALMVAKLGRDLEAPLRGLTLRLIAQGWAANLLGWLLLGTSLWAVLKAIPGPTPAGGLVDVLPIAVAATALAMVAGFLSLLPGGLGVREWIISALLAPRYGPVVAIAAAVALRLVWLAAELVMAGALTLARGRVSPAAEREPVARPRG